MPLATIRRIIAASLPYPMAGLVRLSPTTKGMP